jgi:hypothetical protein
VAKTQVATAQSTRPATPRATEPRPGHCGSGSGGGEMGPAAVEGSTSMGRRELKNEARLKTPIAHTE